MYCIGCLITSRSPCGGRHHLGRESRAGTSIASPSRIVRSALSALSSDCFADRCRTPGGGVPSLSAQVRGDLRPYALPFVSVLPFVM